MGETRIGNPKYRKVRKNGRWVYELKHKAGKGKGHRDENITARDRQIDRDNLEGWIDKIHEDVHGAERHTHRDENITEHDREIDSENGRKASGSTWHR